MNRADRRKHIGKTSKKRNLRQELIYTAICDNKWLKAEGYRPCPPIGARTDWSALFPKQGVTKRKAGWSR